MHYVGRVPAPPLDQFVDDIYCLTGVPRHRRMNVPSMPSAHLFLNLAGPIRLWDPDSSAVPALFVNGWFMGVWTRRFVVEYPDRVRVVGVISSPGDFRRSSVCPRLSCGTDGRRSTLSGNGRWSESEIRSVTAHLSTRCWG